MCRRQVSKQKIVILVLYVVAYLVVSQVFHPEPVYNFVGDDLRVGDKYVLMFLIAKAPTFTDADGAAVFDKKRCGLCFVTNNKGFLPMSEYDAVLVISTEAQDSSAAFVGKRYLLKSSKHCLRKKFLNCALEPRISAVDVEETFDLCGLCQHLHKKRRKTEQ